MSRRDPWSINTLKLRQSTSSPTVEFSHFDFRGSISLSMFYCALYDYRMSERNIHLSMFRFGELFPDLQTSILMGHRVADLFLMVSDEICLRTKWNKVHAPEAIVFPLINALLTIWWDGCCIGFSLTNFTKLRMGRVTINVLASQSSASTFA